MISLWKLTRIIVFLVGYTVDITVEAETLSALKEPVTEPARCMRRAQACTYGTFKSTKFELVVGSTNILMGEKTAITQMDQNRFLLLEGDVWIQAEDEISIETEFGIVVVKRGESLLSKQAKRLFAKNLRGEMTLNPRGGLSLAVERGFENTLTPVSGKGHAETGIPQLLDLRQSLKLMALLHNGSKMDFEKRATTIFSEWKSLVEQASEFHLELANRAIASDNQRILMQERRRAELEAERRRLRKLFREKTLGY